MSDKLAVRVCPHCVSELCLFHEVLLLLRALFVKDRLCLKAMLSEPCGTIYRMNMPGGVLPQQY